VTRELPGARVSAARAVVSVAAMRTGHASERRAARYPAHVARDAQLVALFVGLHVVGIAVIAALLVMFLRAETTRAWSPPDEDDAGGGGGSDRLPPHAPGGPGDGGLPLPGDALPARLRLRDERRLADLLPPRERRPAREPHRVPAPSRPA
jgi:hypothetical protein